MTLSGEQAAPLVEHVLQRNGCPIHYWTGGVEDRPLVVLTHGACVDHHSFDPVVSALASRYRVLTWDVRGHGLSQPMGEALTIPLAVEDLIALLDEMGVERAVLVGHSNGSYIGQEMVFRHSQRVIGLAVIDGTCITWNHSAFERWVAHISPDLMALYPYETLKRASLPYASANPSVQDYAYRAYSMLSKPDFIRVMRGVTDCLHYEPGYHIQQPLLIAHGDHDRMGNIRKIAPRWAALEPNCRYEVIPNASHFAILDNPGDFTRLLLSFLSEITSKAGA